MIIKHLLTKRFCLSFGAALAVSGVIASHRAEPSPPLEGGYVFVYFPSLCAKAGDSGQCHELPQPVRPGFATMEACSAYASVQLDKAHNPKLMASCLRERES